MNRREVEQHIRENAESAGIPLEDIRVQEDPYSGWRIYAVSSGFEELSTGQRADALLGGLPKEEIQWAELLTPGEATWAGAPPADIELEDLPMWPEALARSSRSEPVVFPSDLDQDLPPPVIVSFYSVRGGVGRSTGLAYAANILASRGHSILCVDMDLEAPGLASLFGKEHEISADQGVVTLLLQLDQGETPNPLDHIIRLSESHELYLLPAGLPSANYARRLRLVDPEAWYREANNPLHRLINLLAELPFRPEAVLVDARTGMTPISAPLLFDIADVGVITLFPHPQARTGTEALVTAIMAARSRRRVDSTALTPEPRFLISPVPSGKSAEAERYRIRALDWVAEWLRALEGRRAATSPPIEPDEITHVVMYQEAIATSDQVFAREDYWTPYLAVADWVERFLQTAGDEPIPTLPAAKGLVLTELSFSTGTAEYQQDFREAFVETDVVEAALRVDKPLVLGRKGTGKTAIFRWIAESDAYNDVAVLSPSAFRQRYPWMLGPDAFPSIEREVRSRSLSWREVWCIYSALAAHLSLSVKDPGVRDRCPPELTAQLVRLEERRITESRVVRFLRDALAVDSPGLVGWTWLQDLDEALDRETYLLFDGLDTGFGNSEDDRARRARSIEGLFAFMLDRETALARFRFKILLREDIWRNLRFENKSHLFGRSVRLEWRSQADYFKTVLIQAIRKSPVFRDLVSDYVRGRDSVSTWTNEESFRVWNVLVGERMRGGKTTFSRNWVWNRLADGNGDHGPRALLQLFRSATEWERRESHESPYDRSILRPRALIESLDIVSNEAVEALNEEFKELGGLITTLQALGRSPIDAGELGALHEEVRLAREVGVLDIYEGTEEQVLRYRIPDLYRVGLGITRRGPG